MLTGTISHYIHLFAPPNVPRLPQFKLQLCLESGQMEFYPSLADLETTVLSTVHTVATAMSNVPNIQVSLPALPCTVGNLQQTADECLSVTSSTCTHI